MYKFKEKDNIISVINEDDTVVARYTVDYHWQEKNVSKPFSLSSLTNSAIPTSHVISLPLMMNVVCLW